MTKYKYIDTGNLEDINRKSTTKGYNRTISTDGLNALDPKGWHIIQATMLHEHAAGVKVNPHIRAWMMLKLKDRDQPALAFLDMSMEDFDSIPEMETDPSGMSKPDEEETEGGDAS
jgi:hypothetical protein